MIPSLEDIENYFESVETYIFSSIQLNDVREAANRLWVDVSRHGPHGLSSLPDMIPSLGDFAVPPPPPPPPASNTAWFDDAAEWVADNPWTTRGALAVVVGGTLVAAYGVRYARLARVRRLKASLVAERRQIVVVLGGDTPLALPLILDLEKKGYIVIASVAAPENVEALEQRCHGYVRALVLNPSQPGTVHSFLRSLTATFSLRFPLNTAGDPHVSPSSHAYIHSIICLLTLPAPPPTPAPLEHLALRGTYLAYMQSTHITPLQVIQALLPLLRTMPARARDAASNKRGKKSIIVCLPAPDTRVGLPFAVAQAMSAAATLRGVEVLRREMAIAALTDPSESLRHIRVVVVDVGSVGPSGTPQTRVDPYKAMEHWTASEKLTYGPAFAGLVHAATPQTREKMHPYGYGVPRKPTPVGVFVDHIVGVVSGGSMGWGQRWLFGVGLRLGAGRVRNWMRGERFSVGAGANTYKIASYLPHRILDLLLKLPSLLLRIRTALLPAAPPHGAHLPAPAPAPPAQEDRSETGSIAEHESSAGESVGAGEESWVSLGGRTRREREAEAEALAV